MILRRRELRPNYGPGRVLSERDFCHWMRGRNSANCEPGEGDLACGPGTFQFTDMGMEEDRRFCVVAALSLV